VIITGDLPLPSAPRLLQTFNNTVESKIFTNMTAASLSGLWVGLFLLVMLGIAISCLFNLKTHEKFARQNLWVGRES
jgi:ABC-type nitrate/sulfonate/bicarbonate transport system permease component